MWGGVILTSCDSVESDSFSDSGKIAFVTSDEDETDWGVNTRAAIVSASDFNSKVSSFRVRTNDYNGTGVAGHIFVSKINGNSVFFPTAGTCFLSSAHDVGSYGRYWSPTWKSRFWALCLYLGLRKSVYSNSMGNYRVNPDGRDRGQSVRGVCE